FSILIHGWEKCFPAVQHAGLIIYKHLTVRYALNILAKCCAHTPGEADDASPLLCQNVAIHTSYCDASNKEVQLRRISFYAQYTRVISLPTGSQPTLRQLELFIAAAEHRSFAAAAAEVFVTPNAVSAAVTELETLFNTQLFIRRRAKGLTLTAAGQDLVVRA